MTLGGTVVIALILLCPPLPLCPSEKLVLPQDSARSPLFLHRPLLRQPPLLPLLFTCSRVGDTTRAAPLRLYAHLDLTPTCPTRNYRLPSPTPAPPSGSPRGERPHPVPTLETLQSSWLSPPFTPYSIIEVYQLFLFNTSQI